MSWLKLDDGWYDHPKFLTLSAHAQLLWTKGASYCSRHLTDGAIPEVAMPVLLAISAGAKAKHAAELVAAALTTIDTATVPTSAELNAQVRRMVERDRTGHDVIDLAARRFWADPLHPKAEDAQ